MTMNVYRQLETRFARLSALSDAEMHLHWDQSVMMPPKGAEARGEQLAALKAVCHGMITAPDMGELIDKAESETGLDDWQAANLREMKRQWVHAAALSEEQVEALSRAVTACETKWREARDENNYESVRPLLQTVLDIIRECAEAKSARLGLAPYDALLDEYSPGVTEAMIDEVFGTLETFLPDFLPDVMQKQAQGPKPLMPEGPFPADKQRQLGVEMMARLGFDFNSGRLDESLHPFSSGTPDDLRITTRYDEDDFAFGLMGVLHETGHALYDHGLPKKWRGQPVGSHLGMDIHESQSLLVEMQACRSPEFLRFAAPVMRDTFGGSGPAWTEENIIRLYSWIEPGLIRVDADEVTYPAHVILRYNLERDMIAGRLALADLPEAWNAGMQKLLGITPPDDALGCMQDIHWFDGAWGYFPSYTLGAIAGAQLFDAAKKTDPEIMPSIAQGNFSPLLAWLRENVHSHGRRYPSPELLTRATGRPLDVTAFTSHLRTRYIG